MSYTTEAPLLNRRKLLQALIATGAYAAVRSVEKVPGVEAHEDHPYKFPLSDGSGWHFSTEGMVVPGEESSYPEGYSVRNPVWGEYQRLELEGVVGLPLSQTWSVEEDGHTTYFQAFQKQVLEVRQEADDTIAKVKGRAVFDELSRNGKDAWLEYNHSIPPVPWSQWAGDERKPQEQVEAEHYDLLNHVSPRMQEYFQRNPTWDWRDQYGLPMAVRDNMLRTQNAVLKEESGKVSLLPAGEIIRERTDGLIIPTESLLMELSERWRLHNFPFEGRDDGRRLPDSIVGSPLFVSEMRKVLEYMRNNAPAYYQDVLTYVYRMEQIPSGRPGQIHTNADTVRRIVYDSIEEELKDEGNIRQIASGIVHETHHNKLFWTGRQDGEKYGELSALKAQRQFLIDVGDTRYENFFQDIVNNIDDPAYQWWNPYLRRAQNSDVFVINRTDQAYLHPCNFSTRHTRGTHKSSLV